MHNLKAIRAMALAVGVGMVGACGQALDCIGAQCVPDQIYHGPLSAIDGHTPAQVTPVTMQVGAYGWGAFDADRPPERKPASPHPVSFDKSYLEVNEQGLLFDPAQLQAVLDRIELLKEPKRPVFVFTYAHGWHHNARTPPVTAEADGLAYNAYKFDYFMARFAEHVRRLYELNGNDNAPIMLGVYVGWRGKSTTDPLANDINVGNRALAADVIARKRGAGSLYDALKQISDKLAESGPSARMIATGHSLGGRLMSRMFLPEIAGGTLHPLGRQTLIAAIEPAISAACYDDIFAARDTVGQQGRLPSFIAITSKDDVAVVDGFRFGHLAPTLDPPRCNENSPARNSAIGVYAPYVTHFWEFKRKVAGDDILPKTGCKPPEMQRDTGWLFKNGASLWQYPYFDPAGRCPTRGGNYHSAAWTYELTVTQRDGFKRAGAVWNVQTDRFLIDDAGDTGGDIGARHNGFSSTGLADMLGRIAYAQINWQDEGAGATVPEPTAKR